jgi:hypothetical protein
MLLIDFIGFFGVTLVLLSPLNCLDRVESYASKLVLLRNSFCPKIIYEQSIKGLDSETSSDVDLIEL